VVGDPSWKESVEMTMEGNVTEMRPRIMRVDGATNLVRMFAAEISPRGKEKVSPGRKKMFSIRRLGPGRYRFRRNDHSPWSPWKKILGIQVQVGTGRRPATETTWMPLFPGSLHDCSYDKDRTAVEVPRWQCTVIEDTSGCFTVVIYRLPLARTSEEALSPSFARKKPVERDRAFCVVVIVPS
jgi:hypothetical protein